MGDVGGGKNNFDSVLAEHGGLVSWVATRFCRQNYWAAWDDCYAIALETLWRCVEGYNPDKGYKFSTYYSDSAWRNMSRYAMRLEGCKLVDDDAPSQPDSSLEELEESESIRHEIETILASLTPDERTLIEARFFNGLTLEQTGKLLRNKHDNRRKLSKERIRQLEEIIIDKLRNNFRKS